ncbi:hypothetical protein [Lentzea sp. NPDC003310]|uniref:hypothetical protein n=1 Tax=Lentzea sp. NPDC003310 TaxID=3154447 RepID=UPI0033AE945B
MTGWPTLDPAGQKDVLDRLTMMLLDALPPDWERVQIEYRVVGRHSDGRVGLVRGDGIMRDWDPPLETWHRFQDLRGGMYAEGEGTWFGAQYKLERPDKFAVKFNWDRKPEFSTEIGRDQYELEQERFPRVESHQPDWFREGLGRPAQ